MRPLPSNNCRRIHRHQYFWKRRCDGNEQQEQKEEDSLHAHMAVMDENESPVEVH
jgi:hypothetical protein